MDVTFENFAGLARECGEYMLCGQGVDVHDMIFAYVSALRDIKLLDGFEIVNGRKVDVLLVAVLHKKTVGRHCIDRWGNVTLTMETFAGVRSPGPVLRRSARNLTAPVNGIRIILQGSQHASLADNIHSAQLIIRVRFDVL